MRVAGSFSIKRALGAHWHGCRIDEADDRLHSPIFGQHREIRPFDVEWRLIRAAGDPAEADMIMMGLDAAGEVELTRGNAPAP
jgi:hypothetical protein